MIKLSHISKVFQQGSRTITALTDVSLHVPAGQIYGVIGASGAGPGSATIYSDQQGVSPVPLKGVASTVTGTLAPAGQGLPMGSMNPFLAINFSIALNGIFPSRS